MAQLPFWCNLAPKLLSKLDNQFTNIFAIEGKGSGKSVRVIIVITEKLYTVGKK
jgi:hypothetical protein